MNYFGDFATGSTVRVPFGTTDASGASVTFTGTSVRIYKDTSTTERASSSGITLSKDFDSITGTHFVSIDLSDNADAGFYAAGHDYTVQLNGATIASQAVNAWLGAFSLENRNIKANVTQWLGGTIPAVNVTGVPLVDAKYLLGTTFSTPATAGVPDVNLKNIANSAVSASAAQLGVNVVNFGGAAGAFAAGIPSVNTTKFGGSAVVLDANNYPGVNIVDVAGSAASPVSGGVDANVISVNGTTFIGVNVPVDLQTIKAQAVTCGAGVTVPASIASPTNITAGTITTATNVTTVNGLAANVITAASIATDADTEIASAVWDLATSGHTTSGTFGAAMGAAGAGGDPWSTSIPGSYGAGTAGNIVGNRIDAAVSSRLAPTVASRTLDVSATGEAGIDWANVGGQATTVGLSATTVSASQAVASVTGAVGSVTGAVGSVTGAVGSVSGGVGGNVAGSVASVTAAVATTSNIKKNQALTAFPFVMTDNVNHVPTSGLTVSATRSLDGGAFASCANAPSAIGNGAYKINLASTDTNANTIVFKFTATGADVRIITVITQP